jgi:hypothetical protein
LKKWVPSSKRQSRLGCAGSLGGRAKIQQQTPLPKSEAKYRKINRSSVSILLIEAKLMC